MSGLHGFVPGHFAVDQGDLPSQVTDHLLIVSGKNKGSSLVQLTAFVIVGGGTLGAVMVQTPIKTFVRSLKIAAWVFVPVKLRPEEAAEKMIRIKDATVNFKKPPNRKIPRRIETSLTALIIKAVGNKKEALN